MKVNKVSLGKVAEFQTGKLDSNAAELNGKYPFFTCSPEVFSINTFAFDTDAVLLAGNNANGVFNVKFYEGKFNAYQRTYVITPINKKLVNTRWLYFVIKEMTRKLQTLSVGTSTKFLTKKILTNFEIKLPSLDNQNLTSKILWNLENKIQLNTQINQTLEAIAQALFKSWFVDFEPVKAKAAVRANGGSSAEAERAAMRAISGKSDSELDDMASQYPDDYAQLAHTASLFPDKLVDSELGEIPEGWEVKSFGELIQKTIGGDWGKDKPDSKHTEKVKILRGTDLHRVHRGDDTEVPIRYVQKSKLKSRKLTEGDIVLEVSGGSKNQPTGRSLLITKTLLYRLGTVEPASFCRLLRPKNTDHCFFLSVYLNLIYIEGKTWSYQNQSTGISNFQTKIFFEHEKLAFPNNKLIFAFNKSINSFYQKFHSLQNQTLTTLRDTLLPKLLSGELDVSHLLPEEDA